MKDFKDLLKPIFSLRVTAFVFQVLSIVLSLIQPLLIGRLLDEINIGVSTHKIDSIQTLTIILIVISILDFIVYYLKDYLSAKSLYSGVSLMREFSLSLALDREVSTIDKNNVGDKLNKILNDSEVYARYMVYQIPDTLITFMRIILIYIVLISISIELTAVLGVSFIIYLLVYLQINKKIRPKISKEYEDYSNVMNQASESMEGYESIKINVQEEYFKKRFSVGLNKYFKSKINVQKYNSLDNGLLNLFYSIIPILILVVGAYLVLNNQITLGVILVFYSYTHWVVDPVYSLASLNRNKQKATAALPRLQSLMETQKNKSIEESKTIIGQIDSIQLNKINFRYDDSKEIIKDFTYNLNIGSKVAITGESGSGKTTFAKLLLGLLTPTSGTISVNNTPLDIINLQSYLKQCSYMPQDIFLFSESLIENITFKTKDNDISNQLVAELNLTELFTRNMKDVKDLSGGEKQRVGIARSMYRHPSLLIYDEPTSALDETMENSIIKAIDNYVSENPCILIVITHRKKILEICDTELQISDDGNILIKSI